MLDYLFLGSTPSDEMCLPCNDPLHREEVRKYVLMLRKRFPFANIRLKGSAHDFGTYYEAVVAYDPHDEKSVREAYFVERKLPHKWTEEEVFQEADNGPSD